MRSQTGKYLVMMLAVILAMACLQPSSAQTFKKVKVYGGVPLVQVSAGGVSVWALAANGNPYIYKGTQFVLANTISLTQIAVGGGNLRQKDTVWALNSAGNIYQASKSGTSWVFNQMTGVLSFITVGLGYQDKCHPYEVWGLNPSAQIYRFDYCIGNWEYIAGTLQTIAVGGGGVSGINGNGELFRFNNAANSFFLVPRLTTSMTQVAVGPDSVWALDTGQVLDSIDPGGPCCGLAGAPFTQIRAGGDGVSGIVSNGAVFRVSYPEFRLMEIGNVLLTSISVGSGAGVWGINSAGQVYAYSAP